MLIMIRIMIRDVMRIRIRNTMNIMMKDMYRHFIIIIKKICRKPGYKYNENCYTNYQKNYDKNYAEKTIQILPEQSGLR